LIPPTNKPFAREPKKETKGAYIPGPRETALIGGHPEPKPSGKKPVESGDNSLYSYYDDDDSDSKVRNVLSTVAFVIAIIIIAVVIYMLLPYLDKIFESTPKT
jgi:hypothetical protein